MTFEPLDPTATEPDAAPVDVAPANTATADGLAPDVRRRLVERFEAWIDRVAAGDPPPPGVPPELLTDAVTDDPDGTGPAAGHDLYSVFAGLTGLTGEVRLQGRAFKQLADLLGPLSRLPEQFDELAAVLVPGEAEPQADAAGLLPPPAAMLELVLDLYDRLDRGLRNTEAALSATGGKAGWFDRLRGRAAAGDGAATVRAMRDGYAMTLSRVTAALHQWDVEPIGRAGEPFDPRRMVAVDVRAAGERPPGTVVEVNRSGCAVRGSVVTPAQVTVAR